MRKHCFLARNKRGRDGVMNNPLSWGRHLVPFFFMAHCRIIFRAAAAVTLLMRAPDIVNGGAASNSARIATAVCASWG